MTTLSKSNASKVREIIESGGRYIVCYIANFESCRHITIESPLHSDAYIESTNNFCPMPDIYQSNDR